MTVSMSESARRELQIRDAKIKGLQMLNCMGKIITENGKCDTM